VTTRAIKFTLQHCPKIKSFCTRHAIPEESTLFQILRECGFEVTGTFPLVLQVSLGRATAFVYTRTNFEMPLPPPNLELVEEPQIPNRVIAGMTSSDNFLDIP
jgi:hypothetical protein